MIRQSNCMSMAVRHSTSLVTRLYLNRRLVLRVFITLTTLQCCASTRAQVFIDFTAPALTSVGTNPSSVTTGDFDRDGDLDVAVSNGGSNTVSILTNNGVGSLTISATKAVGTNPQFVVAADLDADGDLDLAVANMNSNTVSILKNNGSGVFSLSSTVSVGTSPNSIAVGDLDGDLDLDLAVATLGGISILANNGVGAFTLTTSVGAGMSPRSIVTFDADGDGDLDLAVVNNTLAGQGQVLRNNSGLSFSALSTFTLSTGSQEAPTGLAAGDLNLNGTVDLIVAGGSNVVAFSNNGSGAFTQASFTSAGDVERQLALARLNGDDFLDAGVANEAPFGAPTTPSFVALRNNGSFGLLVDVTRFPPSINHKPVAVTTGDMNGDGRIDLIYAVRDGGGGANSVAVLFNLTFHNCNVDGTSDALQSTTTQTYAVFGTSTGVDWSWEINDTSPSAYSYSVLSTGVIPPVGAGAATFASAFIASINSNTCPTVRAAHVPGQPNRFTVTVPGSSPFNFGVGPAGLSPTCFMPASPSCTFNPTIVQLSGVTGACCNESGASHVTSIGTISVGGCLNGVDSSECSAAGLRFVAGGTCATLSPPCGSGACCDASGVCTLATSSTCSAMGGSFLGIGTTCSPNPCPPPPTPANDDCTSAIAVPVFSTISGTTFGATIDPAPSCGTSTTAPGVWYSVIGTGTTMTAMTCGAFFDYDTKISVYCGTCASPICVDGNDDDCTAGASALLSTVSWCAKAGTTYLILVHGFSSEIGDFELSITDDLVTCSPPVSCGSSVGACCNQSGLPFVTSVGVIPDGSCLTDVPPADCAGLPGLTFDPGNDCAAGALVLSCGKLVESKWTQLPHGIPSDCCTAHPTAGCDVTSCEAAVCAIDPLCCDAAAGGVWDAHCALLANSICPGVCVGSAGPIGFNVASDVDWQALAAAPQGTPSVPDWVVADDFQSDGRPITCIRWWGSYIDPAFEPTLAVASRSALSSTSVARLTRVQSSDSAASQGSNPISRAIPPAGACCLPGGVCISTTQLSCGTSSGVFEGPGSVCPPGPCTPGTNVDGWLLSFHSDDPLGPGGFSQPLDLLGLYFCPADAVTIKPTGNFGWDGHEVFEYFVELSECHLIHSQFDPRPGATPPDPAQLDAFLETQGFIYWLDIQAVVGHTYVHAGQLFGSEPIGGGFTGTSQIWDITVPGGPDALIGPPIHPISALSGLARCPNSIIGVTGSFGGGTVHIFDLTGTLLSSRLPTDPAISSMAGASTAPPGAAAAGFIPGHVYATVNTTGGGPTDSLYDLGPCGIGPDLLVGTLVDTGGLPIVGIDGLAFDPTTCTLYGSTSFSGSSTLPGHLVAISSAGLVTDIGPILVGGLAPAGSVSGLAFDGGILYGSLGSGIGDIIVIPPAAPDTATFDHSVTAGAGSIAGLTNGQGPSWVEVPTKNRAFDHFWGWHTSPDEWNDASVMGELVMGPTGEWIYQTWLPVDGSLHMLPRVDQAFELLTPTKVACPCLGDMDGNTLHDGLDIQGFVDCLLKVAVPPINCACADMNGDGTVDLIDVPLFTSTLLAMSPCP